MLSRRSFIRIAAGSAATGLAPAGIGPVPPSIAALKPMTALARPFTNQEREARIEKARGLMRDQRIDAIVLMGGASAQYFANISLGGGERLWALVVPSKSNPFIVCPAFEEDRAREILADTPFAKGADIRIWQEDESPYLRLIQGLKDRGITSGLIGIEETIEFVFADGLARAGAPSFQVVSATPVTAGCRMIKSAHEVECLRIAGAATVRVYAAVYKALAEGMTQKDVNALIQAGYARVGFPGEADLNIGEYTALPHGSDSPQTIRKGTIIMLDDGCSVQGYTSDITRTFVIGTPTDKMRRVFEIVQRAQKAALSAAKPGVPNDAIDAAARKVIVDAGYGPGFKYFTHRVGHGLGLEMHEWNYLVANNMYGWDAHPRLQAGMVFSDEPGIYIRGEFGIRLEDDLHVTDTGAELLTTPSPSLEHPFG
ncbi:MAG TPA: Xaa-Pro peptidase family protein [Bryobacteraceae bacterium]|nr:Xaa-Pro peptidase family protein [Bryobacteraceae bacterium]